MSGPDPVPEIPAPDWMFMADCGLPDEAAEGHGVEGRVPGRAHYLNSSAATERYRWADAILGGAGALQMGAMAGIVFKTLGGAVLAGALAKLVALPVAGALLKVGGFATNQIADAAQQKLSKMLGFQTSLKSVVNVAVRSAVMAAEATRTSQHAGLAQLKAEGQVGKLGDTGHKAFGGADQGK